MQHRGKGCTKQSTCQALKEQHSMDPALKATHPGFVPFLKDCCVFRTFQPNERCHQSQPHPSVHSTANMQKLWNMLVLYIFPPLAGCREKGTSPAKVVAFDVPALLWTIYGRCFLNMVCCTATSFLGLSLLLDFVVHFCISWKVQSSLLLGPLL